MNLAIALSAARHGAAIANYTEVVHLLKTKNQQTGREKLCGARCRDVLTGEGSEVSPRTDFSLGFSLRCLERIALFSREGV